MVFAVVSDVKVWRNEAPVAVTILCSMQHPGSYSRGFHLCGQATQAPSASNRRRLSVIKKNGVAMTRKNLPTAVRGILRGTDRS